MTRYFIQLKFDIIGDESLVCTTRELEQLHPFNFARTVTFKSGAGQIFFTVFGQESPH